MKNSVLVLATSLGVASAFWRMECPGRVGVAQIDPIVNPGAKALHMHSIYGSSGFSKTSTFDELRNGKCTSCRVQQDRSAYWTPSLYFQDSATGKFIEVDEQGGLLAYYFLNHDNIEAFPEGFHMLAGNTSRRSYNGDYLQPDVDKSSWAAAGITSQADLAERAVGFNCLNYAKTGESTLQRHYLPDKEYLDANCPDGIRIEIMFPSCWDGTNLDSADHQSHVAYPTLVMTGTCPDTHPIGLPGLMYETFFATNNFVGKPGRFVVSNGDVGGFGYHGDFISGWNKDTLQSAVNTCTNPSGRIDDCPVFDLIPKTTAQQCKLDSVDKSLVAEDGELDSLPGGVAIIYADSTTEGDSSSSAVPTSTLAQDPLKGVAAQLSSAFDGIFGGGQATTSVATSASATTAPATTAPEAIVPLTSVVSTSSPVPIPAVNIAEAPSVPAEVIPTTLMTLISSTSEIPAPTSVVAPTTAAPVVPTSSVDSDAGKFVSTEWQTGADGVVTMIYWDQAYVTATEWIDVTTTVSTTLVPTAVPVRAKRGVFGRR